MTTTTTPTHRYLGITDECVECEQCGKTKLRNTVVLAVLDADGNTEDVVYYGSTCAARVLGVRSGGRTVLAQARAWHEITRENAKQSRAQLALYGLPETGDPDHDTLRLAVRVYVRSNRNVAELVNRTGILVPGHVMEMLRGHQQVLADAAKVGL